LISKHGLPIKLAKESLDSGLVKFPGKIAINRSGTQIAVSDTGNHRVLLINDEGIVNAKVGTGTSGLQDGAYAQAQFNAPQGLCWHGDECLYVADTENHSIRKVCLVCTYSQAQSVYVLKMSF